MYVYEKKRRNNEMIYITKDSANFIYGYTVREETLCCHYIGYYFQLAIFFVYAPPYITLSTLDKYDFFSSSRDDLSKAEVERYRFMLEEHDLIQKEKQLAEEKITLARTRLRKEHKHAVQAESAKKLRER